MFTHDTRTENFLTSLGVKFEYSESVQMHELRPDWQVANLGRKEAIDDDAVAEYGMLMEQGSPAPAVIVIKGQRGYEILDGVQRISGADLIGATSFAAYIISSRTKLRTQRMIRIAANARINGQHTPDKTFLLSQAVEILYFTDSCSAEDIGRCIGRKTDDVKREIRFQKTSKLMTKVGFSGRLSKHIISKVGEHAQQDDWSKAAGPLREVCEVLETCKFRNGHADEIIEEFFDVKRIKSKDRAVQFGSKLATLKEHPEIRIRMDGRMRRPNIDNILPKMRAAATVVKKAYASGDRIHDIEYSQLIADSLREIHDGLRKITPREVQYHGERNSSIYEKS